MQIVPQLVPQFGWPPLIRGAALAGAYLGKSRFFVYRLVASGELTPVARKGRVMVFEREALDRYLLGPQPTITPATLRIVDDMGNA